MEHLHLIIVTVDPAKDTSDKGIFYGRMKQVLITKTIEGMIKDAALVTLNLIKRHWTWVEGDG